MATYQVNGSPSSFNLRSTWICNASGQITSGPTTSTKNVSFTVDIPAGSTINTAYVHSEWSSPKGGFAIKTVNGTRVSSSNGNNVTVPINITSGTVTFEFKFKSRGVSGQAGGQASGITQISNVYLHIDYTIPYTACTAPTSVSLSSNNVAPGASVTLSWSGAGAGNNNAITGYHIYRATSASGTYTHTYTVTTTATSGSTAVTAPTSNGSSYYFKVYTIGTVSGYNSGASSYATLTCNYSTPTAPTGITINGSSSAYVAENETATLAWSGASAGTNNPITGYDIYVGGSLYSSQGADVSSLSIPAYSAGQHTWTVRTIGAYSSSGDSSGVNCYTYSSPTAPTTVSVSNQTPAAGGTVTLSWSGAAAGTYNEITGYHIYRSTASNDSYTYLSQVTTTDTSGSTVVDAPSAQGASYYFKVAPLGERGNGSLSTSYAVITTKIVNPCSAPTKCVLDGSLTYTDVVLSWNAGSGGTNNPMIGYEVQRAESSDGTNWSDWITIAEQTTNTLIVSPPSPYGNYYRYRVKTRGESLDSAWKNCANILRKDHQPIEEYTDSTIVVGETRVKAIHMTELQNNINMLLNFYHLTLQDLTSIISQETGLAGWTNHVNEIRNAIDFLTTSHTGWLDIPVNCPRADIIQQLRDVIEEVHKPPFILGIGKAGAVVLNSVDPSEPKLSYGRLDIMELQG